MGLTLTPPNNNDLRAKVEKHASVKNIYHKI
jgi:hypothetical protein